MTHPSFAISGFGRSGTRFLAELLDRSPTWTVAHEPTAQYDAPSLADRFNQGKAAGPYGEVNSFLLYSLRELPVDRRAVIVRDPIEIVVSYANRNPRELCRVNPDDSEPLPLEGGFLSHLISSLAVIDVHAGAGVPLVSFERMTTDLAYLREIIRDCGVADVEPTAADLRNKVNAAGRDHLRGWRCLGRETQGRIERPLRWFRRAYADLGAMSSYDPAVPT